MLGFFICDSDYLKFRSDAKALHALDRREWRTRVLRKRRATKRARRAESEWVRLRLLFISYSCDDTLNVDVRDVSVS